MTLAELDQALRNHLAAELAQIDENVAAVVEQQMEQSAAEATAAGIQLEHTRKVEVFNTRHLGRHGDWTSLGEMPAEAAVKKFR